MGTQHESSKASLTNDKPMDFLQHVRQAALKQNPATLVSLNRTERMLPYAPVKAWRLDEDTVIEAHQSKIPASVWEKMVGVFGGYSPWPLFLHGAQGRGKTYAARYFTGHVYPKAGAPTVKWFNSIRDLQSEMIEHRNHTIQHFRESAVVVIDNFGATSPELNNFMADELISLFDRRTTKPMVIVSNHGPSTYTKILPAPLVSRLLSGTIIEYKGHDRRVS